MNDCDMIERKLRAGMTPGTRHMTRRDVGRIAGGCIAAGRLTESEANYLRNLAISLSSDSEALGEREWDEAIRFGREQPLEKGVSLHSTEARALEWDDIISQSDYKIVDEHWIEREEITPPSDSTWNPCAELRDYLKALFRPDEHVAYLVNPPEIDGEYKCVGGVYNRTAKEILKHLEKPDPRISEAVGTPNEKCGGWIVINPVDGEGRFDKNVTAFRFALVESDSKPIDEQVAIYKKLELPCACIVNSGGKSAHAIVKIDAPDLTEYRKRVDFLYKVCADNGLPVDRQNRNPSRFSRMPGLMRNGKKQYLISHACGKATWEEWEDWIKSQNDDLPDFEPFSADEVTQPPPFDPELIEGILRVNDKMCVVGPSKAGKSFLLIELAIAIAEGTEWIGRKCMMGKVLYINLELKKASFANRLACAYKELGIPPKHAANIHRWNLRGFARPIDKIAPHLINRAKDAGYAAIIFDPIYKIQIGDENNAADMTATNNCFDTISQQCNCSVIFCHHHSKGGQGEKRAMDRASGSGVVARDADALIDMLPLESVNARDQFMQGYELSAMIAVADKLYPKWRDYVSEDDKLVPNRLSAAFDELLSQEMADEIRKAREAVKKEFDSVTGWRVSFTLRDFASPSPQNLWFKFPIHVFDDDDVLKDCVPEGSQTAQGWKRKKASGATKIRKVDAFKQIVEMNPQDTWTIAKAMERMNVKERTVWSYCKQLGYTVKAGVILTPEPKKEVEQDDIPF